MDIEFDDDDYDLRDNAEWQGPAVIESTGRQAIGISQNLTVITAMLDRKIFERRSATVDPEYPLTSASELDALKGEIAMLGDVRSALNNPQDIQITACTSANGLNSNSPEAPLRVGGIILKGAKAGAPEDNAVSIAIAGTQTIVNTSQERIEAGDIVIADWPEYILQGGKRVPKVKVRGCDGKFLWATRPFRQMETFQQFTDAANEIYRTFAKKEWIIEDNLPLTQDDVDAGIKRISKSNGYKLNTANQNLPSTKILVQQAKEIADTYSPYRWANAGKDTPIMRYAHYLVYMMGAHRERGWAVAGDEESKRIVERTIDGGTVIKRMKHNNGRTQPYKNYGPRDPIANAVFVTGFPAMCVSEQNKLIKQLIVGTALRSADGGEAMQTLIKYTTI